MDKAKIEKLLELIGDLVNDTSVSGQSWQDKKAAILAEASSEQTTNLLEFVGWFDE